MRERQFEISGMSCDECVESVIKELSELDLDYYEVEIGLANIKYDEFKTTESDIKNAITDAGFKPV